jgi:transposase
MANTRIINMDIKQILRLYGEGKSQRFISRALNVHRSSIVQYLARVKELGMQLEVVLALDDKQFNVLFPEKKVAKSEQQIALEQFFTNQEKDQKYTGFTVENHWRTYLELVPDGLSRSRFYTYFQRIYKAPKGSFKVEHAYGQKLFIDFTGKHLHIIDKDTGELQAVELFVGILPASQYIYVQACMSQKLEDFTDCTAHCLHFMGGVPQSITTDNLKSAVTTASKTEPVLNKSFKDLAYHYNTTITPTRAYSPKDKAMVEGAVRIVYCSVFYALRHQQFFELESLNKAIAKQVLILNNRLLSNKKVSRYDQFLEEKITLQPLPTQAFELWDYKSIKVQKMGYVFASKYKNYYSIPYRFIGKQIQVRTNSSCLEAHYDGEKIASHLLSYKPGGYTTIKEHLHSDNQFYVSWSPMFFVDLAQQIGEHTVKYVSTMIANSTYPETAYKSALAIINLKREYTKERIESACKLALDYPSMNCGVLKQILLNKRDLLVEPPLPMITTINVQHQNVRGAQYFSNL